MIWEAILKPIDANPVVGQIHKIRVQADTQEKAAKEVRFAADFECRGYAITSLKEISEK